MAFNTTQEIIEDIRQGKMVILMDDEDRENAISSWPLSTLRQRPLILWLPMLAA